MTTRHYKGASEPFAVGDYVRGAQSLPRGQRLHAAPDVITTVTAVNARFITTADGMRWSVKTNRAWGTGWVSRAPLLMHLREHDYADVQRQRMRCDCDRLIVEMCSATDQIGKLRDADLQELATSLGHAARALKNANLRASARAVAS